MVLRTEAYLMLWREAYLMLRRFFLMLWREVYLGGILNAMEGSIFRKMGALPRQYGTVFVVSFEGPAQKMSKIHRK